MGTTRQTDSPNLWGMRNSPPLLFQGDEFDAVAVGAEDLPHVDQYDFALTEGDACLGEALFDWLDVFDFSRSATAKEE